MIVIALKGLVKRYWPTVTFFVAAAIGCALLVSCGVTDLQVQTTVEALRNLKDAGDISQETFDALVQLLQSGAGYSWPDLGQDVIQAVTTLVFGYLGIRGWRGTPSARKGSLPS